MLDLDGVASVVTKPTVIMATLLCEWVLSERAPWLLLEVVRCISSENAPEPRESDENITRVARDLGFAQKKKVPFQAIFAFLCFGQKEREKKTCAQPWYARKSGNSPAPESCCENSLLTPTALFLLRQEEEPKPKLLGPDVLRWGGGLPREGVGAEKFGMSLETRETKFFWRDIPGFGLDIPEVPEKFEKKNFVLNFRSPSSRFEKKDATLSRTETHPSVGENVSILAPSGLFLSLSQDDRK